MLSSKKRRKIGSFFKALVWQVFFAGSAWRRLSRKLKPQRKSPGGFPPGRGWSVMAFRLPA